MHYNCKTVANLFIKQEQPVRLVFVLRSDVLVDQKVPYLYLPVSSPEAPLQP